MVMETKVINKIIPIFLVLLIIVRIKPTIIKLIVSDVVVMIMNTASNIWLLIWLINFVTISSKLPNTPVIARMLAITKIKKNNKIKDTLIFQ
jgi:hypothetical protein